MKLLTIKEAIEAIDEGEMPPIQYTLVHKDTKLTKSER